MSRVVRYDFDAILMAFNVNLKLAQISALASSGTFEDLSCVRSLIDYVTLNYLEKMGLHT